MRSTGRMNWHMTGRNPQLGFMLAVAWLLPALPASAQEPVADGGLFLTVANPITSEVVLRLKDKTERALTQWRHERRGGKIVYDFNPDNRPSGSNQYGPCQDLAEYLLSLQDVHTIAFVHNEVTRQTVLPVLACKELVMSADARIGDVRGDQPALRRDQVLFYREATRDEARWPIVWKMLDSNIEVLQGIKNDHVWYVVRGQPVEKGVIVTANAPVVLPAGDKGLYDSRQAWKFGLCKLIKDTRQGVAEAYHMPPSSLREDPLEGRTPVAWRLDIRGQVNRALEETLRRRVRRAIGQGANLIILQLDCGGGDTVVAREIAEFFRTLKDDQGKLPVMTVAYIPQRAPDTATFLALGCTEIVMGKDATGKEAELGDFDSIVYQRRNPNRDKELVDEKSYELLRQTLVGLAEEQGYSPLLAQGMLDRKLVIHRVRNRNNPSEHTLISQKDLDEDRAKDKKWIDEGTLKHDGEFLRLTSTLAMDPDVRVARHVVGSPAELYEKYGLDPSKVRDAGPDWLDGLAAFLRHPLMAVFLVMLGITCLVLELKMPGVGLPGVIAALCFVLFFWSHSQLAGQITMLAVLLFILGLVLIGLEVFVLPGFGVTGISGIVLMVVSLGLATLEKKPETAQEWLSFGNTITTFGLSLVAAVVAAIFVGRYLPNIPYANRLVLTPPGDALDGAEVDATSLAPEAAAALLGAIGVAATTLRPAGMARFGDDFVDVVAEGSYVAEGARVQVIEIEGNRIVVKEV